ncbi:MAG: ABC transporter substrate-binding protein [Planctomycetes bacterium]|nr:ABC transporter substrate-binding protein [Planctomycetota bacterium]MBL7143658.1 ABC transporter substrate-binding protein [Phycisphaerae bacterium]
MNKWWWLLLIFTCWSAAGFAIFDIQQRQDCDDTPLPTRADRIVSLAPNLTEILFALGLEKEIVRVTLYSDYPPAAAKKPKAGTFWQPNIEAIISARPDLIVTLGFEQQKNLAERLKRINYNCLTVNIEKVNDLYEAFETIGVATGKQHQANGLVTNIRDNLDKLSALVGTEAKVRVLWVVQREPLRVAGRDTFVNEMIELAGGENAIGPTLHKYPPIGAEQVIVCGADVIIEPSMQQKNLAAQQNTALKYWSKFENVPAVANERIYIIQGDIVSRLSPRLYEGIETIAQCLRPELFEN